MTSDKKNILSDRIDRAVNDIEVDYYKHQSDAEKFFALYQNARDNATKLHEQLILLLNARYDLWKLHDDEEEF